MTGHQQTIVLQATDLGVPSCHKAQQSHRILQSYLDICVAVKDLEGQGAVCSALAAAQQELEIPRGDPKLQKFDIAKQTDNLTAQAEACCNLGVIYNQRKEFDAVHFFEKNFETTRSIVARGRAVESS